MSKAKELSPFKYKGGSGDEWKPGDVYLAEFPLPDDGLPNSEQKIVLKLTVYSHDEIDVRLSVTTCSGEKDFLLIEGVTNRIDALSRMLYGVARVKSVYVIDPV